MSDILDLAKAALEDAANPAPAIWYSFQDVLDSARVYAAREPKLAREVLRLTTLVQTLSDTNLKNAERDMAIMSKLTNQRDDLAVRLQAHQAELEVQSNMRVNYRDVYERVAAERNDLAAKLAEVEAERDMERGLADRTADTDYQLEEKLGRCIVENLTLVAKLQAAEVEFEQNRTNRGMLVRELGTLSLERNALEAKLAAVSAARDEACDLASRAFLFRSDAYSRDCKERIDELRLVGAVGAKP